MLAGAISDRTAVSSIDNQTIDSYEDADLEEYKALNGIKDNWSFISSTDAVDGSIYLESQETTTRRRIASTAGLSVYPSRGDIWDVYVWPVNGNSNYAHFGFCYADTDNVYRVIFRPADGVLVLREVAGGTNTLLAEDTAVSYDTTGFNRIEIDMSDTTNDTIAVTAYDSADSQIGAVSATSSAHDSGGITINHTGETSPSQTRWDFLNITN